MARPRKPTIELPPHVNVVRVKGRPYYYFHPGRGTKNAGKPLRLPDDPRSPEFWAAYHRLTNAPEPRDEPKVLRGADLLPTATARSTATSPLRPGVIMNDYLEIVGWLGNRLMSRAFCRHTFSLCVTSIGRRRLQRMA